MHPAYSVIFFTVSSGAGYGLLILLSLLGALGFLPAERWFGLSGFVIAFGLITAGLLSSMFHLGRPERAWRAFSQWRSSWLSREGVLAVVTYLPAGLLAIGWIFLETIDAYWALLAWLTVFTALATVYCTAMIYASLKTIPQWHNKWVPVNYVSLALASGGVILNLLMLVFGIWEIWAAYLAISLLAVSLIFKLIYWSSIAAQPKQYTKSSATGLGRPGSVRSLDAPHTQPNYLNREMGYVIARKHSARLRRYAIVLNFVVPAVLLALVPDNGGIIGLVCAILAVAAAAIGIFIERWLFFADAEHVVNLYYGRDAI